MGAGQKTAHTPGCVSSLSLLGVSLLLAAAPLRLLQSVQGAPVGLVELEVSGGTARYRVRHVFRGTARVFERSWSVDGAGRDAEGRVPELFALRRRPPPGCQTVLEERTGRSERLCLDEQGRGTLDETPIEVAFSAVGELRAISVLGADGAVLSRFEVTSGSGFDAPVDPFGAGFPLGKGAPGLVPAAGERLVEVSAIAEQPVDEAACLDAARAWVRQHGGEVVLGLVLEARRAWPHAWVKRADGRFVDPSSNQLEGRRYLLLASKTVGTTYLELAAGTRRVTGR